MKRLASALLLASCLLIFASSSLAYVPIRSPQGNVVRWTSLPVYWFYNHNGFQQIDQANGQKVFQQCFDQWEQPACSALTFKFGGITQLKWDNQDRRNVLIWNPNIPDPNFPTALALTLPLYTQNGIFLDADIIFNGGYPWSTNPNGQQFDMYGTVTHEIGHLLGLDHTNVRTATMFPTANPGLCPCRTLKQDDIAGLCALYPGSKTTKPKRQKGQPCDQTNVCDSGLICLVYQTGATTGVCHPRCPNGVCISGEKCFKSGNDTACLCRNDQECGNGATCKDYFCTGSNGTKPTRNQGESCDAQNICLKGLTCVQVQQGATTGVCFPSCAATGSCAGGEKCHPLQNGEKACACLNNQECPQGKKCENFRCGTGATGGGKEGGPCDAQGLCQAGLQCLRDPQSGSSLCVKPCTQNSDCKQGMECHGQFKVCVPTPPAGSQGRGQPCEPQNACQNGLECVQVIEGSNTGVCMPLCTGSCATGETCADLNSGKKVCVCLEDKHCTPGKSCQNYQCIDKPGCANDSQCGAGQTCIQGRCTQKSGCQSTAECPPGSICSNGACVTLPPPKTTCTPTCAPGFICQNGSCFFQGECKSDNDCGSNEQCQAGKCNPLPVPDTPVTPPPPTNDGCPGCSTSPLSTPKAPLGMLLMLAGLCWNLRRRSG